MLRYEKGGPFREVLQSNPSRLITLAEPATPAAAAGATTTAATVNKWELQYQAILIINVLVSFEETWLPKHPQVVTNLLKIWVSESFQERHRKIVSG